MRDSRRRPGAAHSVKKPASAGRIAAVALAGAWAVGAGAAQSAWQDVDDIRRSAETFATTQLATADRDLRVHVAASTVDPRLRLHPCERPLEAFLPSGGQLRGNGVVGVRCAGKRPWKLFVPVRVQLLAAVAVADGALAAGRQVTEKDLRWEEHDVSGTRAGFRAGRATPVGQVLKQAVRDGQVLRPSMLRADHVVRRGQQVTLAVSAGRMAIRSAGVALGDGAVGQRVRARNDKSGRVVEGIVREPGVLEINIH